MNTIFVLLAVLLSISEITFTENLPCRCGIEKINSKIFGGQKSGKNQFPWMTFIYIVKNETTISQCGGSIINDRYILTAAHCLEEAKDVLFLVGSNNFLISLNGYSEVESWKIHENYNGGILKNDIALIKTKKPLKFSENVYPICLPSKGQIANGNFTVAGWGLTENGEPSQYLLHTDVTEYDFKLCNKFWKYLLNEKHICASDYKKDTCLGDSGGPLMQRVAGKIYAAGIISFGPKECGKSYESVFTRVESYLDWILINSNSGSFCAK